MMHTLTQSPVFMCTLQLLAAECVSLCVLVWQGMNTSAVAMASGRVLFGWTKR